ncbi:MAG: DUF2298 domain-containing protein, partial [Chloroflexota bacterium]|nr:DUF2298 domain-containing protein [Chloroflexota bacterium]
MVALGAALVLLTAMGAVGVAGLRRFGPWLDPLERVAYGLPLGVVLGSLAMLPPASAFGFGLPVVLAVGVASAVAAVALWPCRPSPTAVRAAVSGKLVLRPGRFLASARRAWAWPGFWPALVIGAFVVRWAVLWRGALVNGGDGLWASPVNVWWDWGFHLADTMSFAAADNFPPQSVHYAGHPLAYHYLPSLTAAALVRLGMEPTAALTLHSFLGSVLILLGLYAFARRLTGDRGVATLTLVLVLLGGSMGWLATMAEMDRSHSVWGTLMERAWDQGQREALNFRWLNLYLGSFVPQRGWLYGLPLALLVLTLLFAGARGRDRRPFVVAGVAAGLLPLA